MDTLILIISMTAFLVGNIVKKQYTDRADGGMSTVFMFNAVGSVVSALILLLWGGFGEMSLFTLLMGVLFGLIIALQAITNLKALEIGPMSYTQMIISFSTLISALSGAMFWDEKLQISHVIGIALMLISFVLAVEKKAGEKAFSVKWLALSIASFLCNGGIGVMQKVHQSSSYKSELNAFLVISFAVSFVFSMALWALSARKEKGALVQERQKDTKKTCLLVLLMIACGACVAVNHKLNLYLSGVMDSAVFFPIVNGGGLITVTLAAVVFFKEKLSVKQWIGIALGTASVVFLCNPFGI